MNSININENEASCLSQKKQILNYLNSGKSLTQREASALFDCDRLSGRIFELREEGYRIQTEMITNPKNKKRFASYSIINES